jgi:hypothetical protein
MLRNKIHIMHLITQDSCLIIHIPKNERCVAEIALYSSVRNSNTCCWKKPVFASPFPSLPEKNYFCNTGSNHAKFVVNILAFCQLSILMQK